MRVLLILLLALAAPLVQAQASGTLSTAAPEAAPLTRADVREYARLRVIEIDVLEDAESELGPLDNDENGPAARERVEARLALEGWEYAVYQARAERIADALGAMVLDEEVGDLNAELEATLGQMAAMMTAEQIKEARAALASHDADTQAWIDATRPDWPAVREFIATFEQLDAYAAGARAQPPTLPATDG